MTSDEETDRYRTLAEECLKAGRFEEAIALYRQLIAIHPGDDSCRIGLAWAYHDSGRTEQAIDCFAEVFEKELRGKVFTGFAFDELVRIFRESGRYDRLVDICERAAAAQPEDMALLGALGEAYLGAGRFGDAAGIFERMTATDPDASAFFCSLGQARIRNGDFAGGEAAYRRAAAIDPEKAGVFFSRMARIFDDMGQPERTEAALREGLAGRGGDPVLLMALGDVLIRQGRPAEGSAVYEQIIARDPAAAGVYLNHLGHALARARYHLEAVAAFERAIALDAHNPFPYIALSECHLSLGNAEAAEEALRRAR